MAGPTITAHGDVISSALEVAPHRDARHAFFDESKIYRGQIQKIYAIDSSNNDPGNQTGTYTVYDVLIWKPDGSTEVVKRCRALQPLFGGTYNNFLEVLPTDPGQNATNNALGSSLRPGTQVVIGYIGGQKLYGPVILGALPHPNPVAVARRPSQSLGVYMEGEFQGLNFKIMNDGSMEVTFNGPRDESGALTGANGPSTFKIDPQGNISLSTNNSQTVTIDRVNGIVDITNGTTEIKMEQQGSKITTKSDFLIAQVNQDMSMTMGGTSVSSSTGSVTVSSDAAINFARGANGAASEPYVLGNVFTQFMTQVLSAILNHTHTGNLGFPTSPPINSSEFASLAASPIGDKSILSDLIKGDK